jgi:electron transfer flavoprotein alpha subunit
MSIMVYSENDELHYQLLGKARELADKLGEPVISVSTGDTNSQMLIKYGADKIYHCSDPSLKNFNVETHKKVLQEAVEKTQPGIILIGATKRGKEVAPRLAASVDAGCMTECNKVWVDNENRLLVERLTYGGSTIATETCDSKPTVITAPNRAFEKPEPSERTGEVIELTVELDEPKVKVVEIREKTLSDADLENASVIVSAGRGFKAQEDLTLLNELAEILGAQIGCTRPISADLGWMDDWVGISGKKVKPSLYVACGISGTIQHVAGIRDSQIIISINNDENANIHGMSDYSLIGDIYEVVPALAKALKERV